MTARAPSQLGDGAGPRRQKRCRGSGRVKFQTRAAGRSSDNCHHRDRASGGTGGTGADVGGRRDISGRRHAPHQHLAVNRPAGRRSSKHPAAARRTRRSPVCPSPYGGGGRRCDTTRDSARGPDYAPGTLSPNPRMADFKRLPPVSGRCELPKPQGAVSKPAATGHRGSADSTVATWRPVSLPSLGEKADITPRNEAPLVRFQGLPPQIQNKK